jgi:hypothetical protein
MRMDDQRESDNLEDRRGSGMGGWWLRLGGGRMGLGTIAIALVASYFLGINPLTVLNMLSGGGMPASSKARRRPQATGRRRWRPFRFQGPGVDRRYLERGLPRQRPPSIRSPSWYCSAA